MAPLSPALRRAAAFSLLLFLGAERRGVRGFASPATAAIVGRDRCATTTTTLGEASPLRGRIHSHNVEHDVAADERTQGRAGRNLKSVASRALRRSLHASCAAAGAAALASFPRPALAFVPTDGFSRAVLGDPLIRTAVVGAAGVVAAAGFPRLLVRKAGATVTAGASAAGVESEKGKVPVTILSGFLGAGKTTALKRLIENTEGIKVGTIVNDVASVNIDAKLISNPMNGDGSDGGAAVGRGNPGGTVELQNGCACCSLSDELLTSLSDLMKGRDLDAIVVELSGVADPAAVRNNWKQAVMAKHPATEKAELGRVVTVVDSHTFGTDWMTWDTAGKREWTSEDDKCAGSRQVPELLAEQVESADVIILNKIDLSDGDQLDTAKLVVRGLNDNAEMIETQFGKMTPEKILGGIAKVVDDEHDDGHSHEHSSHEHGTCTDPDCTDASHSHSHSHEHSSEACSDPDCSDTSHSHSHSHSSETCADPECTDSSHSHSHSHSSEGDCTDPDCTDSSHSHSHDHQATSTDNLGISNFVYKSSRPFDPRRLQRLLMTWPIPVMEELNLADLSRELEVVGDENSPFVGVLRSKGFAWVAPSTMFGPFNDLERHDIAMYWSHAGKHFGLKEAGTWWASMGKEAMKSVFKGNMDEYHRIIEEDFVSGEWGDRRQEIVFIGANLDEKGIRDALNDCLCADEQVGEYKQAILDAIAEYYAQQ
ncbi:hypothetical protein ACHAWF_010049 [Thalassiosira exigua]